MIRVLTLLLLTAFLYACNNEQHADKKEITVLEGVSPHAHEANTGELVLNKGAKWKADSITHNTVKKMRVTVENFNAGTDKSMAAYQQTSANLRHGQDKMVRECKMIGPDHTSLHKWLVPLIEKIAQFSRSATQASAAQSVKEIHAQIELYTQYFEQED